MAVEEGGEGVYRHGIGAKVGELYGQPEQGDEDVAHHEADEEDQLQEEAAQHQDAQLPLLPQVDSA